MQEILDKYPAGRIKVYVLWAPLLRNDSRSAAQAAARYISDSRAEHFWDLWSWGTSFYSKQLDCPKLEAWDLFAVYKPYLVWNETLPEPTEWFQRRNLAVGEPYTQDKLEASIQEFLE